MKCQRGYYWIHRGWGKVNSGLMFKITNKPGASKGGHIVIVTYVDHVLPREYVHWHKMHTQPDNFRDKGHKKYERSLKKIEETGVRYPTFVGVKKLYYTQP